MMQGLTEEGTPKLGWPCFICGHFPIDYEERGPGHSYTNFPQHLRHTHGIGADSINLVYDEVQKLNKQKIWASCQGIEVKLLSSPSEAQYNAIDVVSHLGLLKPPGDLEAITDLHWGEDLAKLVLPQAMEGLPFVFYINQVSRVCTHQIVRTRFGAAFIQQSQRAGDMTSAWHRMPITIFADELSRDAFVFQVNEAREAYSDMLKAGVPVQDARFIMPQSICTHIGAVYHFLALRDLAAKRLRNFLQWEINSVLRGMRAQVLDHVGPVLADQLKAGCELSGICQQSEPAMQNCGKFPNPHDGEFKWQTLREQNTHNWKLNVKTFGGSP